MKVYGSLIKLVAFMVVTTICTLVRESDLHRRVSKAAAACLDTASPRPIGTTPTETLPGPGDAL